VWEGGSPPTPEPTCEREDTPTYPDELARGKGTNAWEKTGVGFQISRDLLRILKQERERERERERDREREREREGFLQLRTSVSRSQTVSTRRTAVQTRLIFNDSSTWPPLACNANAATAAAAAVASTALVSPSGDCSVAVVEAADAGVALLVVAAGVAHEVVVVGW
jgi:hypothetical protein